MKNNCRKATEKLQKHCRQTEEKVNNCRQIVEKQQKHLRNSEEQL